MKKKLFLFGLIGVVAFFGIFLVRISGVGAQAASPCGEDGTCASIVGGVSVSGNTISVSGRYYGGLGTNFPTCGSLRPPVPEGGSTNLFTWSTDDGLSGNVSYTATEVGEGGQCTGTNQPEVGNFNFQFTDAAPGAHTITISYQNTANPGVTITQPYSYGNTVTSASLVSDNIPSTSSPSQVITTGSDGSPLKIVVKNTGTNAWYSDQSVKTSSVGSCDQQSGVYYECPTLSDGGGDLLYRQLQ